MQLHQLRYFISVAEHLNFTEAAKHLFVAQSAVSQQIAHLEEKVGVKLFVRNKRSVQLTNAGKVFLAEAREIVKKSEDAIEKARKAEAGIIGSLNVGFLAGPVRSFLPKIIRQFSDKYPSVEVKLNHFSLGQLNVCLKNGELDIVFAISLGFHDIEGIESKLLFRESPCVYMNHEHPLATGTSINLEDLANESFVIRDREEAPQWYDYTLSLFTKSGFSPNIISQTKRIETLLMLVDAKLGIAILPNYLDMYASPTIRMIPVQGEENVINIMAYRKLANNNPVVPLFIDELNSLS